MLSFLNTLLVPFDHACFDPWDKMQFPFTKISVRIGHMYCVRLWSDTSCSLPQTESPEHGHWKEVGCRKSPEKRGKEEFPHEFVAGGGIILGSSKTIHEISRSKHFWISGILHYTEIVEESYKEESPEQVDQYLDYACHITRQGVQQSWQKVANLNWGIITHLGSGASSKERSVPKARESSRIVSRWPLWPLSPVIHKLWHFQLKLTNMAY